MKEDRTHQPEHMDGTTGMSTPPRANRRTPATPETVLVKPTRQGRLACAAKSGTKFEVDQALAPAPASAAGAATTVLTGKDAQVDASNGESPTTTPEEKVAKVPRTAAAEEHKIKIDPATAPPHLRRPRKRHLGTSSKKRQRAVPKSAGELQQDNIRAQSSRTPTNTYPAS